MTRMENKRFLRAATRTPKGAARFRRPPRMLGWWLGVLALTGCASSFQPMGPAVGVPTLNDGAVVTADGYRLPVRSWRPEGPARVVLVALHGFNDYSNAYANVGPVLARYGILTYAYDQRGFGATRRPGVWPGTETLIADLETVAGVVAARHPGVPLYVLGESMGGAVVMTAFGRPLTKDSALGAVRGAVLVAPAVWGRETMAPVPRIALWLTNAMMPGMALTAPAQLNIRPSDNTEMLRAFARDPLAIKATRVDAMNGLVELMGQALAAVPNLGVPSLVLYGAHERILPKGAVGRALSSLGPDHRIAIYRDGWHMLLRDRHGDIVIDDVVSWLLDPAAPLPSGAEHARRPFRAG